jgi:hypothetical protein
LAKKYFYQILFFKSLHFNLNLCIFALQIDREMAEWSIAAVLKTADRASGPGVRIPLSLQKSVKLAFINR